MEQMKNKKVFRIAGSILLLAHILCVFLPFYNINSVFLAGIGFYGEEMEIDLDKSENISAVAEMLQKKEGVSQFELIRFSVQGKFERVTELLEGIDVKNTSDIGKYVTIFVVVLFVIPLIVRICGGGLGLFLKKKTAFIISAVISLVMGISVLLTNIVMYTVIQSLLEDAFGEELSLVQSSMAVIGGNADILSYFVTPGIGFYVTCIFSILSFVMAVLSGIYEKTVPSMVQPVSHAPIPVTDPMQKPVSSAVQVQDVPPVPVPPVQPGRFVTNTPSEPKGIMRGLVGMYAGAEIPLNNETIIIGRDATRANLIYDDSCTKVSRKHCELSYDSQAKMFVMIDYSSTGTFKNGNTDCLPQNMRIFLEPGSVIDIGDETNRFILE